MCNATKIRKSVSALAVWLVVLLMLTPAVLAADGMSDQKTDQQNDTWHQDQDGMNGAGQQHQKGMQQNGASAAQQIGQLCSASDLTGMEVQNNQGQTLGEIEQLLVDDNRDTIHYVVVKHEGKMYPVPWAALEVSPDLQQVTLHISSLQFSQAPSMQLIDTEKLAGPDWSKRVHDFYSQHVEGMRQRQMRYQRQRNGEMYQKDGAYQKNKDAMHKKDKDDMMDEMNGMEHMDGMHDSYQKSQQNGAGHKQHLIQSSELMGLDVQSSRDQADLGTLEDLVIDAKSGSIAYGLVSFGGLWGIGAEIAAVPFSALRFDPQQGIAMIDATGSILKKSVIDEDNIDKLSEPQFARQIYDNYDQQPYWEVFGYVPGEEEEMGIDAWKENSSYNQKYDPANTTDVTGMIQSVGTFTPTRGAMNGLKLTVRTQEGESMTVHAGPRKFASQRAFDLRPGQQIRVIGSKVMADGKTAIMARQIRVNDRTLQLRDQQGKPQWLNEQFMQPRQQLQQRQQQPGGQREY